MSLVLILYFVAAGARAVALITTGTLLTVTMGVAMLVLPLIGAWALGRELFFGWAATRLVDRLDAMGRVPEEDIEVHASGRPVKEAAQAVFNKYQLDVESHPDSWEAWARLGIMSDAIGDRKEARAALTRAIRLQRRTA